MLSSCKGNQRHGAEDKWRPERQGQGHRSGTEIADRIKTSVMTWIMIKKWSSLLHMYDILMNKMTIILINKMIINLKMLCSLWKKGLKAMCKVVWLSQMRLMGLTLQNCNSWKSCFSHIRLIMAMAQYSIKIVFFFCINFQNGYGYDRLYNRFWDT